MKFKTIAPNANTFGLPSSLIVPVLSSSEAHLTSYVGSISDTRSDALGMAAALIEPFNRPSFQSGVPLWNSPNAEAYMSRLHPRTQVWVRANFYGYRAAYLKLAQVSLLQGFVLDHVRNRTALSLTGRSSYYVRLCPIEGAVNTSSGHLLGAEGLEKGFIRAAIQGCWNNVQMFRQSPIAYADPSDLTKMLDFKPGTRVLAGVRDLQHLFYP